MDLLQLKYFQTVAGTENITKAAAILYISQPSLSRAISRLEKDLGVPLFERKGKNIFLNQFGKVFLEHVNACLKELESGKQQINDMANLYNGTVSVGAISSRFLPHIFNQYLKKNMRVKFRLTQLYSYSAAEKILINGDVDLLFTSVPISRIEINCYHLATEEVLLAVPQDHPLAGRGVVPLSEVADEPFISLSSEYPFADSCKMFFMQAGFTPNIRLEAPNADVLAIMVAQGSGCALFARSWLNTVRTDNLSFLHISYPICSRKIYVSYHKYHHQSPAVKDFYQFIVNNFTLGPDDSVIK